MDRRQEKRQDRIHLVHGRPVHAGQLGRRWPEAMQQELKPYRIKVQNINPDAYYTGYNETMADAPFRWLDDTENVTKRAALREEFNASLQAPSGHLDAREKIDRMIEIVPADTGRFRNVVPKAVEDMQKLPTASRMRQRDLKWSHGIGCLWRRTNHDRENDPCHRRLARPRASGRQRPRPMMPGRFVKRDPGQQP